MAKSYKTIDVEIRNGNLVPADPQDIPRSGRGLLVLTEEEEEKVPDESEVRALLGWLKTSVDSVKWQRSVRDEWENRR